MQDKNTKQFDLSYRPEAEIIHQRVGDDLIIINLKSDRIYSLNKTGARFWELLVSQMKVSDIKNKLELEFEVEPRSLDLEIQAILDHLLQEGLVHANPE